MKEYRKWYCRGQVLEVCLEMYDGRHFRHPIRPWTGSCWDNKLASALMSKGYTVVIVDYGFIYSRPDVYNEIPESGSQLLLNFD